MATYPDNTGFAFSFSHGRIVLNNKQYTAIKHIECDQPLEEGVVNGTSNKPLRRTAGMMKMGNGSVMFSDFQEATDFLSDLGAKPLLVLWNCDYSLVNEQGIVRSIEVISCRLLNVKINHEQGPEGLGLEYPFSFMTRKINGVELI